MDLAGLGVTYVAATSAVMFHTPNTLGPHLVEWDLSALGTEGLYSSKPHSSRAPGRSALMDPKGGSSSFSTSFLANLTSPGNWESWLKVFPPWEGCSCRV